MDLLDCFGFGGFLPGWGKGCRGRQPARLWILFIFWIVGGVLLGLAVFSKENQYSKTFVCVCFCFIDSLVYYVIIILGDVLEV